MPRYSCKCWFHLIQLPVFNIGQLEAPQTRAWTPKHYFVVDLLYLVFRSRFCPYRLCLVIVDNLSIFRAVPDFLLLLVAMDAPILH